MLARCENCDDPAYKNYGARGISVCGRWHSLDNFAYDMGDKPSAAHTLERIDNDGNYEPGNCKWATRIEQNNNQRPKRKRAIDKNSM